MMFLRLRARALHPEVALAVEGVVGAVLVRVVMAVALRLLMHRLGPRMLVGRVLIIGVAVEVVIGAFTLMLVVVVALEWIESLVWSKQGFSSLLSVALTPSLTTMRQRSWTEMESSEMASNFLRACLSASQDHRRTQSKFIYTTKTSEKILGWSRHGLAFSAFHLPSLFSCCSCYYNYLLKTSKLSRGGQEN